MVRDMGASIRLPDLATTTVGSFPRPGWLATREGSEVTFQLDGPWLREGQDDATVVILKQQELAGLDLLTDGEQRRVQFIHHFLNGLEEVDLENRSLKAIRRQEQARNMVPRVVDRV